MNETLYPLFLWLHLLCLVGAFGVLLAGQFGLGKAGDSAVTASLLRFATLLIAAGLVAGLAVYYVSIKLASASAEELPSALHMLVGIKFMIFLAVGGCLGVGTSMARKEKTGPAGTMRLVAIVLLAVAAFLGVSI